jgi:hypothetical protein
LIVQLRADAVEDQSLRAIFISYRRNDAEGEAGRLFDDLVDHFGERAVFMDVAAIEPGRDFRRAIDDSVAACSVLLAIIGERWLDAVDAEGRRRLDETGDFVRLEIAAALRRDIPVVPVLVRGARMPRHDRLPDDLQELAFRNATELTHARWRSDVRHLIDALAPYVGEAARRRADVTPAVDAAWLADVSRELARYIGPIAEVVVGRAAARGVSAADLCPRLAEEIDDGSDRERFLAFRRRRQSAASAPPAS